MSIGEINMRVKILKASDWGHEEFREVEKELFFDFIANLSSTENTDLIIDPRPSDYEKYDAKVIVYDDYIE